MNIRLSRDSHRIMKAVSFVLPVACFVTSSVASAQPQLSSLSTSSMNRSVRLVVTETGFGASQIGGQVMIDGISAIVAKWMNTQIYAYVPESASPGSVPVQETGSRVEHGARRKR